MYIKNFLHKTHCFLNGRVKEYGIKRCEHRKKGNDFEGDFNNSFGCQYYSSIIKPNVK